MKVEVVKLICYVSKLANDLDLIIISEFVERGENPGQVYNSAGIWVPGGDSWKHVHRKIHLWGDEKNGSAKVVIVKS
ncbi:hypothetical protein [Sodalis glossinidius]|uniref:hypothetical protein n=1 Tax=Sodalis glossinidius TaxID=63612 RepID=UPI001FB0E537|nr:hypothetical protein [Sodalis glossinidius]